MYCTVYTVYTVFNAILYILFVSYTLYTVSTVHTVLHIDRIDGLKYEFMYPLMMITKSICQEIWKKINFENRCKPTDQWTNGPTNQHSNVWTVLMA